MCCCCLPAGMGKGKKEDADKGLGKRSQQVGLSTKWKLGAFWNEVTSDPTGVGFAFGGLEPGRLHAKGKCVDVHKLYYSIGRAGKYRLHVGLRHQMQPFPGSPFELEVTPGPARCERDRAKILVRAFERHICSHLFSRRRTRPSRRHPASIVTLRVAGTLYTRWYSAITTMVPRELDLKGEVGRGEDCGCKLALRSYDFVSNQHQRTLEAPRKHTVQHTVRHTHKHMRKHTHVQRLTPSSLLCQCAHAYHVVNASISMAMSPCHLPCHHVAQMGNRCIEGGARVACTAERDAVAAKTVDNADGTYTLSWKSERAGKHTVQVLINDVRFSPDL